MPKFNFKKSIGRPFMNTVAKPLGREIYNTAAPLVNQGLAQLKLKVPMPSNSCLQMHYNN